MNIFVADDAFQVRRRVVAVLRSLPPLKVVGEANSVKEAIAGILGSNPHAVVLDLRLADGSALDVLSVIKPNRPAVRFVVVSNLTSSQHRRASLAAGADVFLDKTYELGRLPDILHSWRT